MGTVKYVVAPDRSAVLVSAEESELEFNQMLCVCHAFFTSPPHLSMKTFFTSFIFTVPTTKALRRDIGPNTVATFWSFEVKQPTSVVVHRVCAALGS